MVGGRFKANSSSLIHLSNSLTDIIGDANGSSATFGLDESTGWVSRLALNGSSQRMCWLPHNRRHDGVIASWRQKVVIGAKSGLVTILDFSDV
jgi:hypothetical protein